MVYPKITSHLEINNIHKGLLAEALDRRVRLERDAIGRGRSRLALTDQNALVYGRVAGLPEVLLVAGHAREHLFALLLVIVALDEVSDVADAHRVQRELHLQALVERLAGHVVAVQLVDLEYLEQDLGGEGHRRA